MATTADGARAMSIGNVISWAFGVFKSNPGVMLGLTFLFSILPNILITMLTVGLEAGDDFEGSFEAMVGAGLIGTIGAVVIYLIMQAVIVRATFAHARGQQKASFRETIGAALPVILPLFLMSILFTLGIMLGMLLLIVPGIILMVMWAVSSPALIVERLGPVEALGRSRELTKGNRWRIFGLYLVAFIIIMLIALLFAGVFGLAGIGLDDTAVGAVGIVIGAILDGLYSAFIAALGAALYVELRNVREGPDNRQLEEIFA